MEIGNVLNAIKTNIGKQQQTCPADLLMEREIPDRPFRNLS
jgi:hypothetical protein